MIPADTMDEALGLASRELGPACKVLVVPHALLTLPVIQPWERFTSSLSSYK
jgi:hypothetical protein